MHKYNKKDTIVYNTIQFYRLDRVNYLKEIIKIAKNKNFYLGIKIVRGAYHEKEINRAIKLKYKIPVHLNNHCLGYCLLLRFYFRHFLKHQY